MDSIVGTFDSYRFQRDDFVIGVLRDKTVVKGTPPRESLVQGLTYEFHGRWTEYKGERQFAMQGVVPHEPVSEEAIVAYLVKHAAGVGHVIAERMWVAYGSDAVKVLRADPERVSRECGLPLTKAQIASKKLSTIGKMEQTRIKLTGLFHGRHFPATLIDDVIDRWGMAAPTIIQRDPLRLLIADFSGVGWARVDKLYRDLGLPLDRLKRQAMCLWYLLHDDNGGDTWRPAKAVLDEFERTMSNVGVSRKKAARLAIRGKLLSVRKDESGQYWLAEREKAEEERRLVDALAKLMVGNPIYGNAPIDGVTDHQREQLGIATSNSVGILGGNPGAGKTHATARMICALAGAIGISEIAVAAPTGKAAVRITEAMRKHGLAIEATTIHRLLAVQRNGHDGKGWGFAYNILNRLPFKVVVIDEASMLDTKTAADLLEAIPDGGKILFVGDFAQLPPVGHGAPLRDMIAAGVPYGELTEIHRNSGDIVRVCQELKLTQKYNPSPSCDLSRGRNVPHIEAAPSMVTAIVKQKALSCPPKYDRVWDLQVLCAVNENTPVCRDTLNKVLQAALNPAGATVDGHKFRVGDKVICTGNGFVASVKCPNCGSTNAAHDPSDDKYECDCDDGFGLGSSTFRPGELEKELVANGEIGRVLNVWSKKSLHVQFENPLRVIRFSGDNSEKVDLGYAITTHKSQGSQWPIVIVVADDSWAADSVTSWEWWRTADSRAEGLCMTIGKLSAIRRQCQRSALSQRKTFAAEMLRTEIENHKQGTDQ